jgi:hypothetical protein
MSGTKQRRMKLVSPGTIMQFDGNDDQAGLWGFFDVEVLDWDAIPEGYDHNGHHVIPRARVRTVRSGREALVLRHLLRDRPCE